MFSEEVNDVRAIVADGLAKVFKVSQKAAGLAAGFRSLMSPQYSEVRAVKAVSFEVEEGETLAFIGPNGAGKSTTIKMLTGILYPTVGQASVLGMTPWRDRQTLAHRIGCVFGQRSQLWYHLPPRDTFELLAHVYDLPRDQFRRRLGMLVDRFELEPLMSTAVRKLSLGQRMRCEIAASLLHSPRVLFLDEPTVGLDVVARRSIRELITEMNREEGVTVFLTSHDVGDIEQVCSRVMVINHGTVALDTSVAALRRDYMKMKVVRVRLDLGVGAGAGGDGGLRYGDEDDDGNDDGCVDGAGLDIPGVQVLKHKRGNFKLQVNTATTSIDDVLARLMQIGRIADITIADPPLEQIIAEMYAEGR